MIAKSQRLVVSFDPTVKEEISFLAQREHVSMSKIIRDLVMDSLERREDRKLSMLADERLNTKVEKICHNDAWE